MFYYAHLKNKGNFFLYFYTSILLKLEIRSLHIAQVLEITPKILADDRGWFHRVFSHRELSQIIKNPIKQINHSFNKEKGTFRGFHYQKAPHVESKLIRCIHGKVLDMALDLRKGSPTFLQIASVQLCATKRNMIYIPEGFAHGFLSLEDNCELEYYHSQEYESESERGVSVNDPILKLELPLPIKIISTRDASFEFLDDLFEGI